MLLSPATVERGVVQNWLKIQKWEADKIPQPSKPLKPTWVFPKYPRKLPGHKEMLQAIFKGYFQCLLWSIFWCSTFIFLRVNIPKQEGGGEKSHKSCITPFWGMTNSLCILFQSVRCETSILKLSKNGIKKSQPWELHDYSFIRSTSAKLSFYVLLTFKKNPYHAYLSSPSPHPTPFCCCPAGTHQGSRSQVKCWPHPPPSILRHLQSQYTDLAQLSQQRQQICYLRL